MIKLIKEYQVGEVIGGIEIKERTRVYHCSNCNHDFSVKGKKKIKCIYCGEEVKEE